MSFLIPIDPADARSEHVECPHRPGAAEQEFTLLEIEAVLADLAGVVPEWMVPKTPEGQRFVTERYWERYQGPWERELPEIDPRSKKFVSPVVADAEKRDPTREWRELNIPEGTDRCYWKAKYSDFGNFTVAGGNVLVVGPNGAGKTHLAACIAKARKAFWTTGDEVSCVASNDFPNSWVFRSHLVVDDILRGRHTDFGLSNVTTLIAKRLDSNLRTIVTCDKNLESIAEVDRALSSRLRCFSVVLLKARDAR